MIGLSILIVVLAAIGPFAIVGGSDSRDGWSGAGQSR
jgi:hypothetical protein